MSDKVKITPVGGQPKTDVPGNRGKDLSEETLKDAVTIIKEAKDASGQSLVVAESNDNEKPAPEGVKRVVQSRKRVPLGSRNILTAQKRPGFVRRFVNDKGDRVQQFKEAGWKAVGADEKVGDDKAGKASSVGSSANPSVGNNQRAVLMEIPDNYYKEDQKAKQDKIDQVEKEIARNKPGQDGLDGKVSIS